MAITDRKITAWTNPIASEADRPQRTASDMKAVFDSNSNQLKESLNGLIDDLSPTVESAARIKTDQGDARFLRGDGQYAVPAAYEATNGVPSGGTLGQILKKNGAADFSVEWADAPSIASLGAQAASIWIAEKTIQTVAWISDATYADYPYRTSILDNRITAEMYPDVTLAPETDADIAVFCDSFNGGVYLYASAVPSSTVTIKNIELRRVS